MSSKEVWSVEGYEKNDNEAEMAEAFTNEDEARESAEEMSEDYRHLDVYVIHTFNLNGIEKQDFFNRDGSYSEEGHTW